MGSQVVLPFGGSRILATLIVDDEVAHLTGTAVIEVDAMVEEEIIITGIRKIIIPSICDTNSEGSPGFITTEI